MNKPELIKRIAIEMCHYSWCKITEYNAPSKKMTNDVPTDEMHNFVGEFSNRPDYYEKYIPFAEIFVEKLINDKVIQNE